MRSNAESNIKEWKCGCGYVNKYNGKFCMDCGQARNMQPDGNAPPMKLDGGWTAVNAFMGERAKMFFQNGILVYKKPHGQWITTKYEMQDLGKEKRIIANSREVGFEYLVPHAENVNGREIMVISRVVIEYDGRGAIVFDEFVRNDNIADIPEGYMSEYAKILNNRPTLPMHMMGFEAENGCEK